MRLYRFPRIGSIDNLTLAEAETPVPGRGQALVRLRAASLNYRDLMVATGRYGRGDALPDLVPLSDGAGEVVAVGPEVTRVKVGDRVAGIFMQSWIGGGIDPADPASALGGAAHGVLAEYRVFDQDGLVHLPEGLSFEEGAALPCAGVTAWNALYHGAQPLQPGETVLVLGTGGVSILALQFARAAGARVIATSSSDAKLEQAKALGAAELINYRSHPDWEREVLRLTGGRGVDHVVEVGGAGTVPRSIAATRIGGSVSLIGVLTAGTPFEPTPLIGRSVTLRGLYVGSRQMFEAMNRHIALAGIRPVIDRVFPFEQAKDAYRHLEAAGHVGKIVIAIG
ncbi:NADPH:quinone reductase-like Zn-dependent oxidoreductase [Inquilinus ginsengisoli]|uniref:NADPH:quinone reductase-like Zn-dependent oxidoreductase n=1 Tax=Inquilinus ginsengisoli TaxID=363840 RepID=A0ABU1JG36_9PROT|nr:NAD(P)-dependent alcohol dehydrogenase [Inquilinus ginsengisoli]MDR6287583.1 NADPH:quinone reductase-like Zn-dependent oxidoreductase [Inquilinus ginsengisoli]